MVQGERSRPAVELEGEPLVAAMNITTDASRQASGGSARRSARRRIVALGRKAVLAASVAMVASVSAAQSGADGLFEFSELSSPQLFELFTAVGDELIARGAIQDLSAATDAYAGYLVSNALGLQPAAAAAGRGVVASGPGGGAYRIFGARLKDASASIPLPPEGASADVVALVLFTPDNQIGRAGLLTKEVYAQALAGGGAVLLGDPLWRREGVTDITPQIFRVVTGN